MYRRQSTMNRKQSTMKGLARPLPPIAGSRQSAIDQQKPLPCYAELLHPTINQPKDTSSTELDPVVFKIAKSSLEYFRNAEMYNEMLKFFSTMPQIKSKRELFQYLRNHLNGGFQYDPKMPEKKFEQFLKIHPTIDYGLSQLVRITPENPKPAGFDENPEVYEDFFHEFALIKYKEDMAARIARESKLSADKVEAKKKRDEKAAVGTVHSVKITKEEIKELEGMGKKIVRLGTEVWAIKHELGFEDGKNDEEEEKRREKALRVKPVDMAKIMLREDVKMLQAKVSETRVQYGASINKLREAALAVIEAGSREEMIAALGEDLLRL